MIRVTITRRNGVLHRIQSRGHALRSGAESSAPCAAVSVLLKSFGLALTDRAGCSVEGSVPREGTYDVICNGCDDAAWYGGITELFERSLREIQGTWPSEVTVTYYEE